MSTFFISRHPGAIEWSRRQNLGIDQWITHLDPKIVKTGDVVIGTLLMKAVAEVCKRGARFFTLELGLRPELRGRELGVDEMNQLECRLVEYKVVRCAPMCGEEI